MQHYKNTKEKTTNTRNYRKSTKYKKMPNYKTIQEQKTKTSTKHK